jgi:DNA mismatch endonuclease, patch repair protein
MTKAKNSAMTDPLTRSQTMARVKSTDTTPEIAVRQALHAAGFRYRLHRVDLPGKPDIVLPGRRVVVFVHGCFWHSHPGCRRARMPSTRQDYWAPKLARNVARDQAAVKALAAEGWKVVTVWECELKDPARLPALITDLRAMSCGARAK